MGRQANPVRYEDICRIVAVDPMLEPAPSNAVPEATFAEQAAALQTLVNEWWRTVRAEVSFPYVGGTFRFLADGSLFFDERLVARQAPIGRVSSEDRELLTSFLLEHREAITGAFQQVRRTVNTLNGVIKQSAIGLVNGYDPYTRLWSHDTCVDVTPAGRSGGVFRSVIDGTETIGGANLVDGLPDFTAASLREGMAFIGEARTLAAAAPGCAEWRSQTDGRPRDGLIVDLLLSGYYYWNQHLQVHALWPAFRDFDEMTQSHRARPSTTRDWDLARDLSMRSNTLPTWAERDKGLTVTESCFLPRVDPIPPMVVMPGARVTTLDRALDGASAIFPVEMRSGAKAGVDPTQFQTAPAPVTNAPIHEWTTVGFNVVRLLPQTPLLPAPGAHKPPETPGPDGPPGVEFV